MAFSIVEQSKKLASKTASKVREDAIKERDKLLNKPHNKEKSKDDPVDELVRLTASGIGFVSEALHHRKEKKMQKGESDKPHAAISSSPQNEELPTTSGAGLHELPPAATDQSNQFALPATRTPSPPPTEAATPNARRGVLTKEKPADADKKKRVGETKDFLQRHPLEPSSAPRYKLELPVIIPQRRPKTRARGFMRAYAPLLNDAGVSQDAFLDFVDTFNKVLEPNPWLNAINLAGFADAAVPEPFSMLVGIGVELATDAIMEGQSRFRSNRFLDHVNANFFMPRGLVCMVVTWKPDAIHDELITTVDVTHKEAGDKATDPDVATADDAKRDEDMKAKNKAKWVEARQKVMNVTKASEGFGKWPDPAPLVFPGRGNTKEDWMEEYSDKRAQQEWRYHHEGEAMANLMPKPEFHSKFSDPSHPAASGDLVALITGGRYGGRPKVEEQEEFDSSDEKAQKRQLKKMKKKAKKQQKQSESFSSGLSSLLQGDVVYLLVASLESQEQVDQAHRIELAGGGENDIAPAGGPTQVHELP